MTLSATRPSQRVVSNQPQKSLAVGVKPELEAVLEEQRFL